MASNQDFLMNDAQLLFKLNGISKELDSNDGKQIPEQDQVLLVNLIAKKDNHVLVDFILDKIFIKLKENKNDDFNVNVKINELKKIDYKITSDSRAEIQHLVSNYKNNSLSYLILLKKIVKSNEFSVFLSLTDAHTLSNIVEFKIENEKKFAYRLYFIWKYTKFMNLFLRNAIKSSVDVSFVNLDLILDKLLQEILNLQKLEKPSNQYSNQLDLEILSKYLVIFIQKLNSSASIEANRVNSEINSLRERLAAIIPTFNFLYKCEDNTIIDYLNECLKLENKLIKVNPQIVTLDSDMNANLLFLKLLISVKFDVQIFVDWLISNETSFLEYFLFYLKFANKNNNGRLFTGDTDNLKQFCQFIEPELTQIEFSNQNEFLFRKYVQFLGDLNIKLKRLRTVFPYNCQPLINQLESYTEKFK